MCWDLCNTSSQFNDIPKICYSRDKQRLPSRYHRRKLMASLAYAYWPSVSVCETSRGFPTMSRYFNWWNATSFCINIYQPSSNVNTFELLVFFRALPERPEKLRLRFANFTNDKSLWVFFGQSHVDSFHPFTKGYYLARPLVREWIVSWQIWWRTFMQ